MKTFNYMVFVVSTMFFFCTVKKIERCAIRSIHFCTVRQRVPHCECGERDTQCTLEEIIYMIIIKSKERISAVGQCICQLPLLGRLQSTSFSLYRSFAVAFESIECGKEF